MFHLPRHGWLVCDCGDEEREQQPLLNVDCFRSFEVLSLISSSASTVKLQADKGGKAPAAGRGGGKCKEINPFIHL